MKSSFLWLFLLATTTILNAQSVGIGTTIPNSSAQLDITSPFNNKGLLIPRMTTAQRTAIPSPAAGLLVYDNTLKEFYHYDGGTWRQIINSSNNLWKSSSSANYVYNTTDSIGIGTSTPDEKLHVLSGSIYVQDNRTNQNPHVIFDVPSADGNEGGLQFKRSGDTLAAINYVEDAARPNFVRIGIGNAGSRNDLIVNSNGETGMGTADPVGRLHVRAIGGEDAIAVTSGFPGEPSTIQFYTDLIGGLSPKRGFVLLDGYDLKIGTNSGNVNGRFIIRTDGADRMFVDEAGNVSIGTTATAVGYKFHVGGKAICEELKVQLIANWPDYVFNKQYALRPINDLKTFIEQNKHLPGIPSAAEVEKNGLEVGDMQKRMMQKIEELTLYIIELKQEIDLMKKNN